MITIEMQRNGEVLEITVTDTGWGIPEEDMPHLAERFYRENMARG
jgi:signal transduction histidine kinase